MKSPHSAPSRRRASARSVAPTTQAALTAPMETPVTTRSVTSAPLPAASSITSNKAVIAPHS
jgi:hypothetical protein